MKRLFSLLTFVASIGLALASSTDVDGIWYDFDFNNHTAVVTFKGSSYSAYSDDYSGDVVIPATFTSPYDNSVYTVTGIADHAFRKCAITSVTIPNTVTSVGSYAFAECSSLSSIALPGSVTSIGSYSFNKCTSLTSFTIPSGVTSIATYAFNGCTALADITIPSSVTSIANYAFNGCKALTKVNITDLAAWCNIQYGTQFTSHPLNANGGHLFLNNTEITDLVIPDGVSSISAYSFYKCTGLTSITFHGNVTTIEKSAFRGCTGVTTVTCKMLTPPTITQYVFGDMGELVNIDCYVPNTAYLTYLQADYWKNFHLVPYTLGTFSVSATAQNGTVSGGGTYESMTTVVLSVTPDEGYVFTHWSDGNTDNPRNVMVTSDTIFQAVCEEVPPVPQILTMTCAEARAAAMALSNGETGIDSVIITGYVSYTNGTVSRGQQTFWLSDVQDTAQTFQAYWCNLPQNDLTALNVGDKVRINGHLTNYNGTNFEMKNGDVTILERQVITIDTIATTVCEAIAEAESLAVGEITNDFYTMTGVVDSVISSIDSYQRQSFTMSCSTNGKMFEAYKLQMANGVAAQKGDTVLLFGKLQNYNSIPEVISGTAEVIGAYVPEDIVSDPLLAYLQKNFDINNNVVFVCSFAEEVCADIVMVGTYKMNADSSWVTDPAQLIHMQQVPGYPEWYVAAIPYTEGLLAKPVQLLTDGTFNWSFQVGDTASWQYVAGNEMFVSPNGFVGECDLEFPSAGVYVYRSLYFRDHTTPCDANLLTYTVTLMAPDCGGYEPAIIGTFTDWSEGIPMQRNRDGSYTAVITTYKGFEFKFRQAGISDWSNEIILYDEENDLWYANPNLTFEDDTEIFINYFEGRYSQCGSVPSLTSRAKLVWPVVADDRVLPTYPGTIVSDFRDNGTNSDNHFYVWGEGSGDSFVHSYYGEYIPTGGSVNSSYSYLSYTVGTLGWSGAGVYVGGVREWMSADLLRRYIVTNPDKFFLHIAVKARDNGSHSFWVLGNDGYGITLGSTPVEPQYPVYQDFARDGNWHELNIPMVLFAEALRAYTIDTADNVFAMLSGGEPGVTIGLDNVYFFCTERFANLNPPLARVVTEPEVAIDGHSTEPLYSEEPELTINADVNATIAVTDGYAILFDGEELTITTGDSVIVTIRAPWPIMGNGTNTLYISANIIISSSESSLPSSSATKRRLRQEAAGETPVLNDGAIRHPAISRFADVVLADGIQLCAVYYTDEEGNTREGDPSRVVYHAAEQAYGEVDVDTQSFTPATSLVFADSNFYTDYIDGKIEIVDDAIINIRQGNKSGAQKVIIDGKVYILRDGKYYTPLGAVCPR